MSGIFAIAGHRTSRDAGRLAACMGERMRHLPHQRVATTTVAPELTVGRIAGGYLNPEVDVLRRGEIAVWMVGEFYHQESLRRELERTGCLEHAASDAALALAVVARDGATGLTRLDGAFVVVVWDALSGELVIVNDRFGLYPHYYAHSNGVFVVAPELKGLLAIPTIPKQIDLTAIAEFTRFQQLLGERTWFSNIRLLPPASVVRYHSHSDRLELTRYWDWGAIETDPHITTPEAIEEVIRLFDRAIRARVAVTDRVGVYLSGGMDSRTILAYVSNERPVTAITFGQANCRDVLLAREVARIAGVRHEWFPFHNGRWVLDNLPLHLTLTEGMHSFIHQHGVSTLGRARDWIDVNLSGWEGGTIMSGSMSDYERDPWFRAAPDEATFVARMYDAFCREFSWPGLSHEQAYSLFHGGGNPALYDLAFESLQAELAQTRAYTSDRRADYIYLHQHTRRADGNQIVFGRAAFEVRTPYFDQDLVSFLYSLPAHVRHQWTLHRALLTRRNGRLALVPYDYYDAAPHERRMLAFAQTKARRARRRLRSFLDARYQPAATLYADYEHYLRTDLRAWVESVLFDARAQERGFFDPATVRELWARHCSGEELETMGSIVPLVNVELVMRAFVDGDGSSAAVQAACATTALVGAA
ncbi:MAG: hypothetical protein DCC58_08430 [Chloroflexi bacterium]|nr:MAG: hypothetical protein DCC58_08430 [Chloroflexota bacterium]